MFLKIDEKEDEKGDLNIYIFSLYENLNCISFCEFTS
jgi:hypothetical protein